ncbi:hypothetical protein ACFPH6_44490 [Streptomyces xiangluensis]|uniref:Uncharacterized protein n=1 Tax=Streptomyces xiangluensis TaxID=2665720 RepID=A0ABV8Z1X5_9ACTN
MRDAGTNAVADEQAPVHEATRAERPRGRHRKPRPRRMLVAVGGLALAAGALSLMRLAPEPPGGTDGGVTATDIEPAEIEPADVEPTAAGSTESHVPVSDTGSATAEGAPRPRRSPSAIAPPNGGSGPERASRPTITPAATPPAFPRTAAPGDPTAAPEPLKPPTPEKPSPPTPRPPTSDPDPDRPDLCVPIVGLCLDNPG